MVSEESVDMEICCAKKNSLMEHKRKDKAQREQIHRNSERHIVLDVM